MSVSESSTRTSKPYAPTNSEQRFCVHDQTETVEKILSESLIVTCSFLRVIIFSIKYKSDILFSVFLSLDQKSRKLKKLSI